MAAYKKRMNFNTAGNAWLCCFMLLNLNNWHVLDNASGLALDPDMTRPVIRWLVSLYYVSFIFISVLITLNLLIATFLDLYAAYWHKHFSKKPKQFIANVARHVMGNKKRAGKSEEVSSTLVCAVDTCKRPIPVYCGIAWERPCLKCFRVCCTTCCFYRLVPRLKETRMSSHYSGYEPIAICTSCHQKLIDEWSDDDILPGMATLFAEDNSNQGEGIDMGVELARVTSVMESPRLFEGFEALVDQEALLQKKHVEEEKFLKDVKQYEEKIGRLEKVATDRQEAAYAFHAQETHGVRADVVENMLSHRDAQMCVRVKKDEVVDNNPSLENMFGDAAISEI